MRRAGGQVISATAWEDGKCQVQALQVVKTDKEDAANEAIYPLVRTACQDSGKMFNAKVFNMYNTTNSPEQGCALFSVLPFLPTSF